MMAPFPSFGFAYSCGSGMSGKTMEKMDWITRTTNATNKPDKLEGCMNKNISHFLLDRLDSNLNYVFAYKVFCKIIPNLNTQHKTWGKTPSPIVKIWNLKI